MTDSSLQIRLCISLRLEKRFSDGRCWELTIKADEKNVANDMDDSATILNNSVAEVCENAP